MKGPRGFGKRYFVLSAVLAYSVMPKLHSQISRVQRHMFGWTLECVDADSLEEDTPENPIKLTLLEQSPKSYANAKFSSAEGSRTDKPCLKSLDLMVLYPPEVRLLSLVPVTFVQKSCHCNIHFQRLTSMILSRYHFIPRCPYYTVCFAFRRTGVHPPLTTFF